MDETKTGEAIKNLQTQSAGFLSNLPKVPDLTFVPYDVFRQFVDINTENLRQLYAMLHELNMQKNFSIEMDMGGLKFAVSGNHNKSKDVMKAADLMVDHLSKKFYTRSELKRMAAEIRRTDNDVKKGYN